MCAALEIPMLRACRGEYEMHLPAGQAKTEPYGGLLDGPLILTLALSIIVNLEHIRVVQHPVLLPPGADMLSGGKSH